MFRDARGVINFSDRPLGPGYKLYHRSPYGNTGVRAPRRFRSPETGTLKVRRQRYAPLVARAARRYDLDGALLHAIITAESGYNPSAISRKGAQGLMQLMPGTAQRYGVQDCWDPADNLEGGARYLRDLLRMFDDDVRLAVAAYNAGENAVMSYGNAVPPYEETQRYVDTVLGYYRRYRGSD
jgi:soluble lytic murein transglycosylase-like protein